MSDPDHPIWTYPHVSRSRTTGSGFGSDDLDESSPRDHQSPQQNRIASNDNKPGPTPATGQQTKPITRHAFPCMFRTTAPPAARANSKAALGMGAEDAAARRAPGRCAREYGVRVKVAAWAGLTCVQVFAACVLRVSQRGGVYAFSPQSSLVMSEGIKVLLSGAFLIWDARARAMSPWRLFVRESGARLVAHMFCLAGIYCFNNALMFWLFARADPGSITLIKSGATIVSAVLMYFWRGFRLSVARWMVILVQMLGLIVAQYDTCIGKAHLAPAVYAILFLSLFNSSMANVWNEHVVKKFDSASLATKNVHLYFFGAVLNLVVFWCKRVASAGSPRFFEGYTSAGMLVVTSNAFMGIAMNVVYKYADALVKNMATTSTTVALLVLSVFFFQGRDSAMVFVGAAVVVLGTFVYFSLGNSEASASEMRERLDRRKSTPVALADSLHVAGSGSDREAGHLRT